MVSLPVGADNLNMQREGEKTITNSVLNRYLPILKTFSHIHTYNKTNLFHLQIEVVLKERVEMREGGVLEEEGVARLLVICRHVSQNETDTEDDVLQREWGDKEKEKRTCLYAKWLGYIYFV